MKLKRQVDSKRWGRVIYIGDGGKCDEPDTYQGLVRSDIYRRL
jgi:hypothetical protein